MKSGGGNVPGFKRRAHGPPPQTCLRNTQLKTDACKALCWPPSDHTEQARLEPTLLHWHLVNRATLVGRLSGHRRRHTHKKNESEESGCHESTVTSGCWETFAKR